MFIMIGGETMSYSNRCCGCGQSVCNCRCTGVRCAGPTGPRGPAGPIGPIGLAGPAGPTGAEPIAAFGGMYNDATVDVIHDGPIAAYAIQLDTAMPMQNIAAAPNGLTIELPGVYEIAYFVNFSYSNYAYFEFYLEVSGLRVRTSVVRINDLSRTMTSFERSFFLQLPAGAVLRGFMDISDGGELYIPAGGTGLMAKRLGA